MTRPRSNALTPDDPRLPNWLKPDYAMAVPNPLLYHYDPSGYMVCRGKKKSATEGWKFHVSAHPWTAEAIAAVVLAALQRLDVYHKYLPLHKLPSRVGVETGKFIAYYPISPLDAHTVANDVTAQLSLAGFNGESGPAIQDELAFGPSGIVYTRYGSYSYEFVRGPAGSNTQSMDPPRGVRAYHQNGRIRPRWIPDLLTDFSNAPFPTYDARRELRGLPESDQPWVN